MVHGWMYTFGRGLPLTVLLTACGSEVEPEGEEPPGGEESTKTEVLEGGAAALQTDAPLEP